MFKETEIREREFSLGELFLLGAASIAGALLWQAAKWMAAQRFGTRFVSRLVNPHFIHEAFGFLVGPAILGGVAGSFRNVRPIAREFLNSPT